LKKLKKKIIIFIINKKWLYPQKKSVFKIYDGLEQLQEYKVDFSNESKVVTTYPVLQNLLALLINSLAVPELLMTWSRTFSLCVVT
jgi:hypothetical protein